MKTSQEDVPLHDNNSYNTTGGTSQQIDIASATIDSAQQDIAPNVQAYDKQQSKTLADSNIKTDGTDVAPVQSDTDKSQSNKKNQSKNKKASSNKKKKKVNLWPLKALIITFFLSAAVNIGSELALSDAQVWLTYAITVLIVLIGVFFDMIGTASTACDIQPFLAMASRKVKGAKTAVKLAKASDAVSSVCNDIVGDICGIVSGVCAATIVANQVNGNLWLSVLVYALISTATITLKAVGKGFAVKRANSIIFATAKVLSIFKKEG